jgi:hypothetical protein
VNEAPAKPGLSPGHVRGAALTADKHSVYGGLTAVDPLSTAHLGAVTWALTEFAAFVRDDSNLLSERMRDSAPTLP